MRKHLLKSLAILAMVATIQVVICGAASATEPGYGRYTHNAVFLSHSYVKFPAYSGLVQDLAIRMHRTYRVDHWFTNAGKLNSSGRIDQAPTELASVVSYLIALKDSETSTGASFHVLAWLNGNSADVDVTNAAVRSAIVDECTKLVSESVPGSYIAGANRAFDGIVVDIEPAGKDDTRFFALVSLMEEIKAAVGSEKLTGFTAPKFGTANAYEWSAYYYSVMALHVDFLVAMTYDSGSTTGVEYKDWQAHQVLSILAAVSTNYTSIRPLPPSYVPHVFFGLPAYPANLPYHDPNAENIQYGAQGLNEAIAFLISKRAPELKSFYGAAVFAHVDGTYPGFATWDTDWNWFLNDWVGF
jgi:hypothetical protein